MSASLPVGIYNPGNFCYINSCIQSLKYIQPVINLINGNREFDSYISAIFELVGITSIIPPATIKARIDVLLETLDANPKAALIIKKFDSNQATLRFMLEKVSKESNKIFIYIGLRNLLTQLLKPKAQNAVDAQQFYGICAFATRNTCMSHIVDGGQNDAVEFLMCILDYLHDSHSQPIVINIPDEVLKLSDAELDMLALGKRIRYGLLRDINTRYAKEHTTFNKELYFYILNMVCCAKCEHISLNYNPYNILCLSLNNTSDGQTIYDCMDKMFSLEVLDCEYKCEKCKNPAGNTIEKKILTRPKTLIICLKRFEYYNPLFGPTKINSTVTYPLMLDISKYYPLEESEPVNNLYKLTCVVNHIGRVNYGHYYSYCYDAERECWFNFNDDRVSVIPPDIVLNNSAAYILFYQKVKV